MRARRDELCGSVWQTGRVAKSWEQLDGTEPAEEAIPILVEAQGGRLFSLAMRFCGNREEAEDLVQETFLQAYRNWSQFQGRSSPTTWLYTIASRLCRRMHRKRAGEPDRLESLDDLVPFEEARIPVVPDDRASPLAEQVRAEGRRRVEAAIASLPDDFRMPLVLKEILGFSVADVAAILDLKAATVKTRLHRARLRVRKAMEDALPTEAVPPAAYSKQVCLDLLQAKQDALDHDAPFEFPDNVVCERCAEIFATLDLARDLCGELGRGALPSDLRREVLARVGP